MPIDTRLALQRGRAELARGASPEETYLLLRQMFEDQIAADQADRNSSPEPAEPESPLPVVAERRAKT